MADPELVDLLARIVLSSRHQRFYLYPQGAFRSNRHIVIKVNAHHIYGLLFKLGILKKTQKKVIMCGSWTTNNW